MAKTAGLCPFKGAEQDFVTKDTGDLANIIKFNEKFLTYWYMAYDLFGLLVAFRGFRLNK